MKCLAVFGMGGIVMVLVGQLLRIKPSISLCLYAWHTLFCFAYAYIAIKNGGDAIGYYTRSFDLFLVFDLGTNAVVMGISFLTRTLGFSFLCTCLAFNIVGATGLLLFLAALKSAQKTLHWSSWLILILPSVSFWSAGIGKDPLSFFASALFAWWIVSGGLRIWPVILALLVMGLARPHIAIVLAAAGALFGLIQIGRSPIRALVGLFLIMTGGIYLFPIVLQKMNLESFTLEDIGGVVEGRESQNLMGGSSIEISGMPIYLKIFTYLFRPMPFDAADAFQLLNSLENIVLLLIVSGASCLYFSRMDWRSIWRLFPLLATGLFLCVFLSLITANLGIAVRQKWMALVPLLVVFATAIRTVHSGRSMATTARPMQKPPFYPPNGRGRFR